MAVLNVCETSLFRNNYCCILCLCFIQVMRHFGNKILYCLDQPLLNVVICCNRFTVINKNEICRPIASKFVTWVHN